MSGFQDFNQKIIDEFRSNDGKVDGQFAGAPLLLLHTKGRKSGKERVNPLAYQDLGDAVAVFGSKGGMPTHPEWYFNALADPDVTVERGSDTYSAKAREAVGDERERIWTKQKELMPGFADYEKHLNGAREIPVIVLERS